MGTFILSLSAWDWIAILAIGLPIAFGIGLAIDIIFNWQRKPIDWRETFYIVFGMSKPAKQIGDTMKIGFATYTIVSIDRIHLTHVPYYGLVNGRGDSYTFIAHRGLTKNGPKF